VGVEELVVGGPGGMRVKARMLAITNPTGDGPNGGPIVDNRGRLVGLAVKTPGLANINRAIDVTEIRAFLAEKKVIVAVPPPPEPPAPAAGDERAANQALRRAKLFADGADTREVYRSRLNDLIRKYPDTAAAREARKLLDGLK
jgi:hypothetical protein